MNNTICTNCNKNQMWNKAKVLLPFFFVIKKGKKHCAFITKRTNTLSWIITPQKKRGEFIYKERELDSEGLEKNRMFADGYQKKKRINSQYSLYTKT